MGTVKDNRKGIMLSVLSSVIFAIMYAYTLVLEDFSGEEIYAWRIILTASFVTIMLSLTKEWKNVCRIFENSKSSIVLIIARVICAAILGFQMWLFMWAPNNGHSLDVSIGYLILPLALVSVGVVFFREPTTPFKILACLTAAVAVSFEILSTSTPAWPTYGVFIGYSIYYYLKKKTDTNNVAGLWFDIVLNIPTAIFFIGTVGSHFAENLNQMQQAIIYIIGLGVLSSTALFASAASANHLSLQSFGFLSYVEPILLVMFSLYIGEPVSLSKAITLSLIFISILILLYDETSRDSKISKLEQRNYLKNNTKI